MSNYIKFTSCKYEVSKPDQDGEICIEFGEELNMIWLTKEDVLLLLSIFKEEINK